MPNPPNLGPDGRPASPPSLTETLLEFARPLALDSSFGINGFREALGIASLIWNAEVARESGGHEDYLAHADSRLRALPPQLRTAMEEIFGELAAHKRQQFAGDLRAVGKIDVRRRRDKLEVSVEEIRLDQLVSPRPRSRKAKRFVVDMRHYLPEDGLMARVPRPALVLANYFGAIAAAASQVRAGPNSFETDVPCRKRSGAGRCTGKVTLLRDRKTDRVDWFCPGCGESGTIDGWRGTPWDLAERKKQLQALAAHDRLRVQLRSVDKRALEAALGLHAGAIGALVAAQPAGKGWTLDASRNEVEDLAVAMAAEIVDGEPSRGMRCAGIAEQLDRVLGIGEDAQETAITANILCFRARAQRSLIRGVARVEGATVHRLSVVIEGINPVVRRDLLVRSDTTLEEFHAILQIAFGWSESHLHLFRAKGRDYMRIDQAEEINASPSHLTTLLDIAPETGSGLLYEYDFGDCWEHAVRVTEVRAPGAVEEFPRCLDGEGAAPPEDVGGTGGYEGFLAALADPKDPRREEVQEWLGRPFDPRAFDLELTDRFLRQLGRWQA